jgi:type II secretory pathway pseudopilin PulG
MQSDRYHRLLSRLRGITENTICFILFVALFSALAVQRYRETSLQGKTSRIHTDLQAIAAALEEYRLDHDGYPPALSSLTTPVAYLAPIPRDPYGSAFYFPTYHYRRFKPYSESNPDEIAYAHQLAAQVGYQGHPGYGIFSVGPSRNQTDSMYPIYDPTNGTEGVILEFGP